MPTFNTSQAGGAGAAEEAEAESGISAWETRFGLRVDMLAAAAYVLSPLSGEFSIRSILIVRENPNAQWTALLLLILETHNDYVRFHGMSSAVTTPSCDVHQRMTIHSLSVCFVVSTPSTFTHIGVTVTVSPIPAVDLYRTYHPPLSLYGVGLIMFEHVPFLLITSADGRHIWAQLGMASPDSNYPLLAR